MTGEASEMPVVASPKLVADGATAPAAAKGTADEAGSESQALAKEGAAPEKKIDTSKLSENEIPVLTTAKTEKKAEGGAIERLLITLGVLSVVLAGATFAIKRWAAKSGTKNQNTKIKVLTQHMLGPKKSLAIVQVAGETILIGVTDQNISMLKTLSLLDEEIPEEVPRNFGRTLADFDDEEAAPPVRSKKSRARQADEIDPAEDFAMRGLSEIRDVVSTRLKGLKNL
jgi:flagellar protein FliO/FliZ